MTPRIGFSSASAGSGAFVVPRRQFLRVLSATALAGPAALAACAPGEAPSPPASPTAASSAAPSGGASLRASSSELIKLGFIALTDCASLVMAQELGLFKKYGLNVEVVKQASWASTRDNLLTNEIQGAHCLFGMPFSVYTGVGGPAGKELHIERLPSPNSCRSTSNRSTAPCP